MRGARGILLALVLLGCTRAPSGSHPGTSAATAPGSTAPVPSASALAPVASARAAKSAPAIPARTKTATVVARSGQGFLEDQGGCRILHVKGTPYERGLQYGELLGDEVAANLAVLTAYAQTAQTTIPPALVPTLQPLLTALGAAVYRPSFPPDVLDEIRGVVDGAARRAPPVTITADELVFMSSIIDAAATVQVPFTLLKPLFKCSGTAVLPPLTANGKVFQERNVDLMVGTGLESHAVLVIEKPAGAFTWANATWAGMLGSASGMNEHGVALSQVWAFSVDIDFGQPWILTARRVLETCADVDGVQAVFAATRRTYGSNFVFADRGDGRGTPRAIALESTARHLEQFDDADPREDATFNGVPLPIRIPHAVFRGDMAMAQAIHALQYHVPPGVDPRTMGGYRDRYKQQADMIQAYAAAGTPIGLAEMETISKKIAMPNDSLQCVVYENTDLVLHVANSRLVPGGPPSVACREPFHDYDLDYYLPTASVAPDKAAYAAGDALSLTLSVENHGRPRRLDARAFIESGGALVPLASAPVATVEALNGKPGSAVAALTFPSVPAGAATIVVELDEAGTRDAVDFATADVTVK